VTAFPPLAQAGWGTVPDWVTAFGTILAFLVALRLLAKELAARWEVEEDRRRAQARLVAVWRATSWPAETNLDSYIIVWPALPNAGEPTEDEPKICAVVKNGSDEPVYGVRAVITHHLSRFAPDPESAYEEDLGSDEAWRARRKDFVSVWWSMLAPQEIKGALLPNGVFRDWHVVIGVSFTDSQGRRWKRFPYGPLIEVTKRKRPSRKDHLNAWIAGELDCLDY
jgi:hypothetical protein